MRIVRYVKPYWKRKSSTVINSMKDYLLSFFIGLTIMVWLALLSGCMSDKDISNQPYRVIDTTVEGYDGPHYAWWRFWDDAVYIEKK